MSPPLSPKAEAFFQVLDAIPHWLLTLTIAFGAAAWTDIQTHPANQLTSALQSWQTSKPLIITALLAGSAAFFAQAKKSWRQLAAPLLQSTTTVTKTELTVSDSVEKK
jgi:hypothetical protein